MTTDAHRLWDRDYADAIYVGGSTDGGLTLTLPDGNRFEVGPEQARELRKALQRIERRVRTGTEATR